MSMFFRRHGDKTSSKNEECLEDDEEVDIIEIVEIITKSTQADVKDLLKLVKASLEALPTIKELKDEIKSLKAELKYQQDFNRELIHKLIDKPPPVSSASQYLANKAAAANTSSASNATAGPKGKLP